MMFVDVLMIFVSFLDLFARLLFDFFFNEKLVTRLPIFQCPGLRICQNVALGLGNVFPKFLARVSLKIQGKSRFFMFPDFPETTGSPSLS